MKKQLLNEQLERERQLFRRKTAKCITHFTMRVNGIDGLCACNAETHEDLTFAILHIFDAHKSLGYTVTGFFFERK